MWAGTLSCLGCKQSLQSQAIQMSLLACDFSQHFGSQQDLEGLML